MKAWTGDNGVVYYDCQVPGKNHEHETPSDAKLCAMAHEGRCQVSPDEANRKRAMLTPTGPAVLLETCGEGALIDLCWSIITDARSGFEVKGREIAAIGEKLVSVLVARRKKLDP